MKAIFVCSLAALAAAVSMAAAEDVKEKSAVFPGDLGRPFDGLPLPTGPRAVRPGRRAQSPLGRRRWISPCRRRRRPWPLAQAHT